MILKTELKDLFICGAPLIDVRAPCEFAQGSIPGSVNLPILNDEERAQVGTMYKQLGQAAAIDLGHRLVTGHIKAERMNGWLDFIRAHPGAVILCFRGGLRSQTAQQWLKAEGCRVPRLEGGYKYARNFFLKTIERYGDQQEMLIISGATGSGKTLLLKKLSERRSVIDLEALANHRGSAFGAVGNSQPTQVDFENSMACQFLSLSESELAMPVLLEDESRLIGRRVIPESLFAKMRNSSVVIVEESLESRVNVTFEDYILNSPLNVNVSDYDEMAARDVMKHYFNSLQKISRRLGGVRTEKARDLMQKAWEQQRGFQEMEGHRMWIEYLLHEYYDPMYMNSLKKRAPQVMFSGSRSQCLAYLS